MRICRGGGMALWIRLRLPYNVHEFKSQAHHLGFYSQNAYPPKGLKMMKFALSTFLSCSCFLCSCGFKKQSFGTIQPNSPKYPIGLLRVEWKRFSDYCCVAWFFLLKKKNQPWPLFHLFLVFSNKYHYNNYNRSLWKMPCPSRIQKQDLWHVSLLT